MTWVKLDDHFDENPKVYGLTDSAFRLYVKSLCWCARKESDGRIPHAVGRAMGSPRAVKELVGAGLWLSAETGFEVKDFLAYNPSHAQLEAKRASVNSRVRGHRRKNGNTSSNGVTPPVDNDVGEDAVTPPPGSRIPDPEREISPSGPPSPSRPKVDRFGASFLPVSSEVSDLHEAWKRTTGLSAHRLKGPTDLDAVTLSDAIELHGLALCKQALSVAMADSMVNGTGDERGTPHKSIAYIFGNSQTFARLVQASEKANRPRAMGTGRGPLERAMAAKPDTSDVYVPTPKAAQ